MRRFIKSLIDFNYFFYNLIKFFLIFNLILYKTLLYLNIFTINKKFLKSLTTPKKNKYFIPINF